MRYCPPTTLHKGAFRVDASLLQATYLGLGPNTNSATQTHAVGRIGVTRMYKGGILTGTFGNAPCRAQKLF